MWMFGGLKGVILRGFKSFCGDVAVVLIELSVFFWLGLVIMI